MTDLIGSVIESALTGLVVAIIIYWSLSKQRYALRLIDLISFAFGFLAFGTGLFSAYLYQEDSRRDWSALTVRDVISDMQFDAVSAWDKVCDKIPHTPYQVPSARKIECAKLRTYVRQLKAEPQHLIRYPSHNIDSFSDSGVRALAEQVAAQVKEVNDENNAYSAELEIGFKVKFFESAFRELSLPVLAFAFGLGVARRTIDLYGDLPKHFQARLKGIVPRKALELLASGKATLSEAARLAGVGRQVVANWAKHIDIEAARDKLLAQQWAAWLKKLDDQ
jgi:hypothetical protein